MEELTDLERRQIVGKAAERECKLLRIHDEQAAVLERVRTQMRICKTSGFVSLQTLEWCLAALSPAPAPMCKGCSLIGTESTHGKHESDCPMVAAPAQPIDPYLAPELWTDAQRATIPRLVPDPALSPLDLRLVTGQRLIQAARGVGYWWVEQEGIGKDDLDTLAEAVTEYERAHELQPTTTAGLNDDGSYKNLFVASHATRREALRRARLAERALEAEKQEHARTRQASVATRYNTELEEKHAALKHENATLDLGLIREKRAHAVTQSALDDFQGVCAARTIEILRLRNDVGWLLTRLLAIRGSVRRRNVKGGAGPYVELVGSIAELFVGEDGEKLDAIFKAHSGGNVESTDTKPDDA